MEAEEAFPDLPSELWINVLLQGGPALLSSCSRLCKQLHQAVSESSVLHRHYAQECFAVTGCEPPARTSWRDAFLHCCRLWRGRPALPAWSGRFLSLTPHSPYQMEMELEFEPPPLDALLESESLPEAESPLRARTPLAASVVAHSDQAGEFEAYGFPATNALRHNGVLRQCWCTSTMHDRNVALLVRLDSLALVTGVGVVNPAEGFDCPVKQLLAFAFMEDPGGLEGATRRVARFRDGGQDAASKATVARLEALQASQAALAAAEAAATQAVLAAQAVQAFASSQACWREGMPPSDQPARAARQARAHSLKVARTKATQAELAAQVVQSRCGAWGGWGRPKQA